MHHPSQPSLPHTQGLADSAIDAAWALTPPDSEIVTTRLLPIVVGAHPRSEIADRPLANRLLAAIRQWQRQAIAREEDRLMPMVMTDLWYLHDLRSRRDLDLPPMHVSLKDGEFRLAIDGKWLEDNTLIAVALESERDRWQEAGLGLEVTR